MKILQQNLASKANRKLNESLSAPVFAAGFCQISDDKQRRHRFLTVGFLQFEDSRYRRTYPRTGGWSF